MLSTFSRCGRLDGRILENINDFYSTQNEYDPYTWIWVSNTIKSFENKPNPFLWGSKDLKRDIEEFYMIFNHKDSLKFREFIKKDYNIVLNIQAAYNLHKKHKNNESFEVEREIFMSNNVYNIFKHDSNTIVLGQLGLFHTILSTYKKKPKHSDLIRLAKTLNSDSLYPLTNKKVSSNIIYYQNTKPKHYSFLQVDFKKMTPLFNEMENCDLFIKEVNNGKVSNLILYKNR